MTKLARYCEGVVEAVWLSAVISVPLFYNIRGESIESEKNYLLRSLAVVLFAAWAIKAISQWRLGGVFADSPKTNFGAGTMAERSNESAPPLSRLQLLGPRFRSLLTLPLALPTLLFGLMLVIATVMSVSPWLSFWGVVLRRVGSYTALSCLLFFPAMVSCLRSERQVQRIISASIATTIPICFYAIGQKFALEPIIRAGGPDVYRVGSTFAHAVYLAAYLIMILPFTLTRLIQHLVDLRSPQGIRATSAGDASIFGHLALIAIYALAALMQVAAVVFTASRGPFVGMVFGLFTLFLMLAIYWRKRWLVMGTLAGGIVLLAGLILLSLPKGPFPTLASKYEVQRLTQLLKPKAASGERDAAWMVAAAAGHFSKTVETGDGQKDRLRAIRWLIGYGPENTPIVSRLYCLKDFNRAIPFRTLFDRMHNDFWDMLLTTGILGLAAYLGLTFLVVYFGCSWLGLVATPGQRLVYWLSILGSALAGGIGFVLWQGGGYLGVGVRLGASSGLVAYLFWMSWRKAFDRSRAGVPMSRTLIMMALVAAVVSHLIEISFSFVFETSLLCFWMFVALLWVVGRRLPQTDPSASGVVAPPHPRDSITPGGSAMAPAISAAAASGENDRMAESPAKRTLRQRKSKNSAAPPAKRASTQSTTQSLLANAAAIWSKEIVGGLLIALVLSQLGVILIHKIAADSIQQTLIDALTRLPGNKNAFTWTLLLSTVATAVVFAAIWTTDLPSAAPGRRWIASFGITLAVGGALAALYWFVVAKQTVLTLSFANVNLGNVPRFLKDRFDLTDFHYAYVFAVVLLMAASLVLEQPRRGSASSSLPKFVCWVAPMTVLAAAGVVYGANLRWSRAGVMERLSKDDFFRHDERWTVVVAIHEEAIRRLPVAADHHLALAKILIDQAAAAKVPDVQEALFQKAERVLELGSRLRPLEPAFPIRQANLYLKWALAQPPGEKRKAYAVKTRDFYRQALVLDPGNYTLWNNLAYVELALFSAQDESRRCSERSLELYPEGHSAYGLLGDAYYQKGLSAQLESEKDLLFRNAMTNFVRAIELSGRSIPESFYRYNMALARTRVKLHQFPEAASAYLDALEFSPRDELWRNEEIIARLLGNLKRKSESIQHLNRALELAPAENRASLTNLQKEILALP